MSYYSENCIEKPDYSSFIPHYALSNGARFGVECEIEHVVKISNVDLKRLKYWNIHKDGSLRGVYPIEYVFNSPLGGIDVIAAAEELEKHLLLYPYDTKSLTSSMHVHVDMRKCEKEHTDRFLFLYTMFEGLLFKAMSTEFRERSPYCSHTRTSANQIRAAAMWLRNGVHADYEKYSSLNLKSFSGLGSFECRIFPTARGANSIIEAVSVLSDLYEFSKNPINELEYYLYKYTEGPLALARDIFKNSWLLLEAHATDEIMLKSMRTAQHVLVIYRKVVSDANSNSFKAYKIIPNLDDVILHELDPNQQPVDHEDEERGE
jgi:hypothetical protein